MLTTVDEVKAWMGQDTPASDAVIRELIPALTQAAESMCNRRFLRATVTERFNGNGLRMLGPNLYPIVSVDAIAVDGVVVPAAPEPRSGVNGFTFDKRFIYYTGGGRFTRGWQNVLVTFTGGYDTDALPADLRQAATEWCAYVLKERSRIGQQSKSIQGETVTFLTSFAPDRVKRVLLQYTNYVATLA